MSDQERGIGPQSGGWQLSTADLPQGIAIITRSSRFLEVNDALARMIDVDASQLTDGVRTVSASDDAARGRLQQDFKAVATAGPGHYEISIHRGSGDAFPAEVSVVGLDSTDPDHPGALLCIVIDRTVETEEVELITREQVRATQTLNSFPESIAVLDAEGTILSVNKAWEQFASANGGSAKKTGIGANYLEACARSASEDAQALAAGRGIRAVINGKAEDFTLSYKMETPGGLRWYELWATKFHELGDVRVSISHEDVTERRLASERVALQAQLLDQVDGAVIACDHDERIIAWSRGAVERFGTSAEDAIGRTMPGLIRNFPDPITLDEDTIDLSGCQTQLTLRGTGGKEFAAHVDQRPLLDADSEVIGTLITVSDITEHVAQQRELAKAYEFAVTIGESLADGLLTLDEFGNVLNMNPSAERMLGWTEKELAGEPVYDAIGYSIELDQFEGDWVKRVDDDVFLTNDGREISVSHTSAPFTTPSGLRGAVVTFTDITLQKQEHDRLELEIEDAIWSKRIHSALENDDFQLYVQPIYDVETRELIQNELLIRLVEADGTVVSPGAFLPSAERLGLMDLIDRWVITQAAEFAGAGNCVEFNLSAGSLSDPNLADLIIDQMQAAGADPSKVVVEITETAIIDSEKATRNLLQKLRDNGFRIALDDFGTGYGSFTYLKNLPVDYLKIDIEFVRDLPTNASSRAVVEAVASLAGSFGLRTVAEGVEDEGTVGLLSEIGIDQMQGFALGRPQPFFIDPAGKPSS